MGEVSEAGSGWLIGFSAAPLPLESLEDLCRFAIDHSFAALEFYADFPQANFELVPLDRRAALRALAEEGRLYLALHAPFKEVNLAAFNPGIYQESIRQVLGTIDLAADLGARVVVAHAGIIPGGGEQGYAYGMELAVEAYRRLAERAEERQVRVGLENVGFPPNALDREFEVLESVRSRVGSRWLGFTLDFGHARLHRSVGEALSILGPHVIHLHITDNFGNRDDHVEIGRGTLDYRPHLAFLREFRGAMVIELALRASDTKAKILRSRNTLLSLLGDTGRSDLIQA